MNARDVADRVNGRASSPDIYDRRLYVHRSPHHIQDRRRTGGATDNDKRRCENPTVNAKLHKRMRPASDVRCRPLTDLLLSHGAPSYAYTSNGELKLNVLGTDSTTYRYDAFGNPRDVYLAASGHISDSTIVDITRRQLR